MRPPPRGGRCRRGGQARTDKEQATRAAFRDGELGLDRYRLRGTLKDLGVEYVTAHEFARSQE